MRRSSLFVVLLILMGACGPGLPGALEGFGGDGDTSGDGDGDPTIPGDGDGDDTSPGDGDDTSPGDGDGDDTSPGDGDGDDTSPGDGDGDPPPPPSCDGWIPVAPLDPLPPDACLTRGSLPFDPAPPSGPFPADPGEVLCGTGWGHGSPTPSFAWSVEISTTTGRQDMSLAPGTNVLVISNSFQNQGSEILRYDALTGAHIDTLDVSGTFKQTKGIVALAEDRWIVAGTHDGGGLYDDSILALLEDGEVSWSIELGEVIAINHVALSQSGDILVASGSQYKPARVHRVSPEGALQWAWEGAHTATRPHITEAPGGEVIFTAAAGVVVFDASGDEVDGLSVLSHRHLVSVAVGDDLLVLGNGRAVEDPSYTWLEATRWSLPDAQAMWTRAHRRALSWNGSTSLYSTFYSALAHPCGGFVAAGLLPVQSPECGYQSWVVAFDSAGEIIWADRIHRCAGVPVLAVGPLGDVWVLTNVGNGTTPLLRRYAPS